MRNPCTINIANEFLLNKKQLLGNRNQSLVHHRRRKRDERRLVELLLCSEAAGSIGLICACLCVCHAYDGVVFKSHMRTGTPERRDKNDMHHLIFVHDKRVQHTTICANVRSCQ